jgi:hypothetical protein
MRMHHDYLVNIPLSVVLLTADRWMQIFIDGSWFFGTMLPYIGFVVGCMQAFFLIQKFWRWLHS